MTDPRHEIKDALFPLAWTLNFIWCMLQLMFWFFTLPILIVCWCFYHPVEARLYFVSAIPLLSSGNWVSRGLLVLFVLLITSLFGKTMHMIFWGIIKLVLVVGVILYICMIFKLA